MAFFAFSSNYRDEVYRKYDRDVVTSQMGGCHDKVKVKVQISIIMWSKCNELLLTQTPHSEMTRLLLPCHNLVENLTRLSEPCY